MKGLVKSTIITQSGGNIMNKGISVVIPVYLPSNEHREMTDSNILIAKERTQLDVEWIIIETASQDYIDYCDVYVHEHEKTTPNQSVNRGFRCASGDYVIFLANDVTVCDGWIEKMLECFDKHDDCGLATLGNNEHKDTIEDRIKEGLPFFFTVSMMRKDEAYLDQSYDYYFDDTDLIFRLHTKGLKVYKNLKGLVHHKPHSTYGKNTNIPQFEEDRQIFLDKYIDYASDPLYKILGGVE